MSVAALQNIEKTFGKRVLFDKLHFNIERGERLGFIGPNGAGKTTLFKVLTGEVVPDMGTVSIARGTRVGHLSQDPVFDPANSVMDEAELAFADLHVLSHKMRDLEHAMGHETGEALDKTLEKYQTVQHEFDLAGGYAWRHRLEATLLGVGLPEENWEQNVKTLSGGQRSRLALAKILISEPDLLLLDEPTNHLDLVAIEWLEKYLLSYSGAVLLISHDRYLLDRLATRVVWLTEQRLRSYPGNYSSFVEQRDLQELTQQRAYEEQQADIEKQKEFIRRFGAGQRSKEAKGREKRLNRLLESDQVVRSVQGTSKINLNLQSDRRAGDHVLMVRDLSKAYGERTLWTDVRLDVQRGERIGIIGPNGSGKTTFLMALIGKHEADAGSIKWGANLQIGYYDQRLDEFNPDKSILDTVAGDRIGIREKEVRDICAMMLFRNDDVLKTVGLLSGGERARVRFCQLLLDKPNVLVLDEPTNHLDIPSREALESALADFPGTVLCVSHDRFFLDQVIGRLVVLQPPDVLDYAENYSGWAARMAKEQKDALAEAKAKKAEAERSRNGNKSRHAAQTPPRPAQQIAKKKDNPYARPFGRLSMKDLEAQISETEISLAECQSGFAEAGKLKNSKRTSGLQTEFETLSAKLKALEAEYFQREQ